jgi:hypothetical protein
VVRAGANRVASQRSFKYLQAVLRGTPVVAFAWVTDSVAAARWLPDEPYRVLVSTCSLAEHPGGGRMHS